MKGDARFLAYVQFQNIGERESFESHFLREEMGCRVFAGAGPSR